MSVIALSTLRAFWTDHPRSQEALANWEKIVSKAQWASPADVLVQFPTADVIGDDRIIFNIRGNEFRLVVHFKYRARMAYVCFVGTHRQYDKIDPGTI